MARSFAKLMFQGKTQAALQLLTDQGKGGLLHLHDPVTPDSTVKDVLKSKHPPSNPASPDILSTGVPQEVHPVSYDAVDTTLIRSIALKMKGAAGPSGLDAYTWRRMCSSFKTASSNLCHSIALAAKRMCTTLVDPVCVAPLLACRLVALDKNPGVRPIGIGDTARRIIAKAVVSVIKDDVLDAAGSMQLCVGQMAGVESAVHAVRKMFDSSETEAVLLVDASNAFNSLNRKAALHNIRFECSSISTILVNTYREASQLFIDGEVLYSEEDTTQGDPLAMHMYALATLPLIQRLPSSVKQVWYADDAAALGSLACCRDWWDVLAKIGPSYGYFPNPNKTWLIMKEACYADALAAFEGTNINVTCSGHPYLGSAVGTPTFVDNFASEKIAQWCNEIRLLSAVALTQPHAAYAAFTHGFSSKWSYLSRTTPRLSSHFEQLENVIRFDFIPALTGNPAPDDHDRQLFALPAREGGLGLGNPATTCELEYNSSRAMSEPLMEVILQQSEYSYSCLSDQIAAKSAFRDQKHLQIKHAVESLRSALPPSRKRAMELASEKGASSWLTTLPIEEYGFCLHKGAFADALALRYGWSPTRIPVSCVCGSSFTVDHVLSCARGGFPILRHNEIRDVTADLLSEVCHDVRTEPDLQPLTGESLVSRSSVTSEGARLDIAVNGFWGGRYERTYLDVRVFNPHAPSNRNTSITNCYRKHEAEKKRAYEQRIREVEHSSFTPLVFSATGEQGSTFYKRLAALLAEKRNESYSSTLSWIRCLLSFSLLRSAIQCIRGARSSCGHAFKSSPPIDLVIHEALIG